MNTYEQAYQDGQQARFDFSGDYTGGVIVVDFVIKVAGTQAGFAQMSAAEQSDYISAFRSGWAAGPKDTVRDQVLVQATTDTETTANYNLFSLRPGDFAVYGTLDAYQVPAGWWEYTLHFYQGNTEACFPLSGSLLPTEAAVIDCAARKFDQVALALYQN